MIREQYDIPEKLTVNSSTYGVAEESARTDQVDRYKLVVGTFLHEFYNEMDLNQFLRTIDGQHQTFKMPTTTGPCTTQGPTGEASLDIQVTAGLTAHETGDASTIEMLCYTQLRDQARGYAPDNQEPFFTFMQDVNAMQPHPPSCPSATRTTSAAYRSRTPKR